MTDTGTLADLTPDSRNLRRHTPRNVGMIVDALGEVGAARSIVVDENGVILAGNATIEAAAEAGIERVRFVDADGEEIIAVRRSGLTDEQKRRLAIFDNRAAELAEWDTEALAAELADGADFTGLFESQELDDVLASLNASAQADTVDEARKTLQERFIVPPFSVLDARQGYWQERKRAWIALGIQSELGRGVNITWNVDPDGGRWKTKEERGLLGFSQQIEDYRQGRGNYARGPATSNSSQEKLTALQRNSRVSPGGSPDAATRLDKNGRTVRGDGRGRTLAQDGAKVFGTEGNASEQTGTSIFDPVLCEVIYRWFCPPGGAILDPFAGGSVRGIVAARTGHPYTGIDLHAEQIAANEVQAATILTVSDPTPSWLIGDSRNLTALCPDTRADLVFTCPPYFDLEQYSDDPADLSAANDYTAFLDAYRAIINQAAACLADNRFAAIVVGDIRDKAGLYRNFVSDTIGAFADAGCRLYNEAILVTMIGSLPIRTGKAFPAGRKLGKTHQNVLVFIKGDANAAVDACGDIEVVVDAVVEEEE